MSGDTARRAHDWLGHESPDIPVSWSVREVLTYALAVGADPVRDAPYLNEAAGPRLLPTFATVAAGPWVPYLHQTIWADEPAAVLTGLAYRVHGPVAVPGTAVTRVRVTGYEVKPSAVLLWLATATSGEHGPLMTGRHCVLLRGGGDRQVCGEVRSLPAPGPRAAGAVPRTAAVRVDSRAVALYRLLLPLAAGQQGPDLLHADAAASAAAGLGDPSLHGVAVVGHVGVAIARMLGEEMPRVRGFGARFRRPVHPGGALAVSAWPLVPARSCGPAWELRAADETGEEVLDGAWIETLEEDA